MTEIISRKYGHSGYEIIIKTTGYDHYKATEAFARKLIDHAKPQTNADRIRAMSDEELMQFLFNEVSNNTICSFCVPTMRTKCKCDGHCKNGILEWLKQPAEEST